MLHLMRQSRSLSVALSLSGILKTSLYDEHQAIVNRWYDARKGEDGAPIMAKSLENFLSQYVQYVYIWVQLMCLISVPFIHQAGAQIRSGKYWHPMMHMCFILESAVVKAYAWVFYKGTTTAGLAPEFTHLEFHSSIALALAADV